MKKIIAGFVILFSSYAQAGSLSCSDEVEVMAVNGVGVEKSESIKLKPGKNMIQIRYVELFDDEYTDSSSWYRSKPAFVSFNVESGDKYFLDVPEYSTLSDAEQFDTDPKIALFNNAGDEKNVKVLSVSELVNALSLSLI
ncbi:DUF2057 family protein [Shewanella sp. NIFS-20-20]|uniref:DUF2057 family protein n=1 Tax=Shewanella sp. NIFS-20-20 TaxID=2853806 RepID=UPI001C473D99|nr:DUF2057 family protein [Shewanella sp. NIFS-20-20]MBV7317575.1 DUF2057 domain-containing protein [Shewanella sp. NIFS-20-20]